MRKNPWNNPEYREKMKHRKPISFWKGKKMSEEVKKKMSETRKGKSAYWNKGKKLSVEHREKIRKSLIGNTRKKGKPNTYIMPLEKRKEMSEFWKGEKSPNWKGGLTPLYRRIRNSGEYRLWRTAVFKRDNYTCVWCGLKFIKGITGKVILQADHIKPFALFPELRFSIDNGRTLCLGCHKTTDTYAGRTK